MGPLRNPTICSLYVKDFILKKTGHSNQSNRGGSGGRKPQGRNSRTQSNGNGNRGRANRNAQAAKMWMDASPQTLTSHIPMLSNTSRDAKRGEGRNGNSPRSKGQNKFDNERKRRHNSDRGGQQTHPRNRNYKAASSAPSQAGQKTSQAGKRVANIEPFELFCAYHLGINRDKQYKSANINEVGRRFNVDPATIRQALQEYGMDSGSLLDRDFDMALAQLDIQVAPEGVDRVELAKGLYKEFQEAPTVKRDWKKIIEEDRRENQKTFRN